MPKVMEYEELKSCLPTVFDFVSGQHEIDDLIRLGLFVDGLVNLRHVFLLPSHSSIINANSSGVLVSMFISLQSATMKSISRDICLVL